MRLSVLGAVLGFVLAFPSFAQAYAYVVNVAKSGGDTDDPIAALDSITDASAATPYLVKVHPGVYDLGTRTLYGKPYVDIEGSGEGATILRNQGAVIFQLASNEEVRGLTFRAAGSALIGYFVKVAGGPSTTRFVTIDASQRTLQTKALLIQLPGSQAGSLVRLDHVTATPGAGADAVQYITGKVTLDHCVLASGNTGLSVWATPTYPANIVINESDLSGFYYGLSSHVSDCSDDSILITRSKVMAPGSWAIAAPAGCRMFALDSIIDGQTGANVKCVGSVTPALEPVVCQ